MLSTYPPIPAATTGVYMGAKTWLNLLLSRNNWLYGQAHAPHGMFRQTLEANYTPVWGGELYRHSTSSTLWFTARMNVGVGGYCNLEYWHSDLTWHVLSSDSATGARWFGGSSDYTVAVGALSLPADNMLKLRFTMLGGAGGGLATVYRASLNVTAGLTAWPTIPTFANSPTVHTAADFNQLINAQTYLYERAQGPNHGANGFLTEDWPVGSTISRWSFVYTGTQALRCTWVTYNYAAGEHIYIYLCNELYPASGARLSTLKDCTTNEDTTFDMDLSGLGLTTGTRYQIELVEGGVSGVMDVELRDLHLRDLAIVPTRTNNPHAAFAHGNQPTAAEFNTIAADLLAMKDVAGYQSPIFNAYDMATAQIGAIAHISIVSPKRFRPTHRWRYLRYRGAGRITSVQGKVVGITVVPMFETGLSDSTTPGDAMILDLDSISWLEYGAQYYVQDSGGSSITNCHEDYA